MPSQSQTPNPDPHQLTDWLGAHAAEFRACEEVLPEAARRFTPEAAAEAIDRYGTDFTSLAAVYRDMLGRSE